MELLNEHEFNAISGGRGSEGRNKNNNKAEPDGSVVSGECLIATTGMMISAFGGPISFIGGLITAINSCVLNP